MSTVRESRPDALHIWNPLDHLRLLFWVFFAPKQLDRYRSRHGKDSARGIGTWLSSTLLWIPLMIPVLAIGVGALPTQSRLVPIWLIIIGILVGWGMTVALGIQEAPDPFEWRSVFGPVFDGAFIMVFGIAFGVAFGTAFITGLDMMKIVTVPTTFGQAGLIVMVAAFGMAFGMGYLIADKVAFSWGLMIGPLLAMCITGFVAFGIGFVGAFAAIFLTVFGMAFIAAFLVCFLFASLIVKRLERGPDGLLARIVRVMGLALLLSADGALLWICLLGGWRVLLG